jgi:lysozyme
VLVGVVVLLAGVAGGGYLYLSHWRPDLEAGERYGLDVSNHQGTIDWKAVAGDGISFAYLKATEGQDWVDQQFAANWRGAGDAGIKRGAYHFFSLCSPGAKQADHFLATVPPDPDALAPALDLETAGNCATRPTKEAVAKEVRDFVDTVEAAWGKPIVMYVGDDWLEVYSNVDDRQQWYRHLIFRPDGDWHIWQLHNFAEVNGVETRVDLNIMR